MVVRGSGLLAALSCFGLALTGCSSAGSGNSDPQSPTNTVGGSSSSNTASQTKPAGGSSSQTSSSGGASSTGGASAAKTTSGGTQPVGGSSSTKTGGGSSSTGGTSSTAGTRNAGGTKSVGGTSSTSSSSGTNGGTKAGGGTTSGNSGGTKAGGGTTSGNSGGTKTGGGTSNAGGTASTGGTKANGGTSAAAGSTSTSSGNCTFTATPSISSKIGTVGIVEWSVTGLSGVTSAQIVYTLKNPGSALNKDGTAPVDLTKTNYKTLLLGLKQKSDYTFHIEATGSGGTCTSEEYTLPTTGSLSGAPSVTRTTGTASASQAKGFIVTSTYSTGNSAYILDADGAIVWAATAPQQCSRARMDYEGANMWMLALNVMNSGGEMRFVSMDGQTSKNAVSGLSAAHHDFTVLPKKIAALVWTSSGTDPESNLVEMNSDGTGSATTVFKIGANLYAGGSSAFGGATNTFHVNSILYHADDGSFTFGDRNPNLYVKASGTGTIQWQFGGSCSNAPAGSSHCVAGDWKINHGHHLLDNGNILIFNNGAGGMGGGGASHVFEYKLSTSGTMSATLVKDFTSSNSSDVLGDVQRLPNGNTLITYSTTGVILEVDSSWNTVQTLKTTSFGYADWRETLYGAPARY